MIYVATYVPVNVCFGSSSDVMRTGDYIDMIVDILFTIDILVNFLSAYEDPITLMPVVKFKDIAKNYVSGWFALDVVAVMPVQVIESLIAPGGGNGAEGGKSLKLARLARLPRLYRLIRILRMLKMLRIFRNNGKIKQFVDRLDLSVGVMRMINVLVLQFFMVHLMACFWYMAASLEENMFHTWVGERGVVDDSKSY